LAGPVRTPAEPLKRARLLKRIRHVDRDPQRLLMSLARRLRVPAKQGELARRVERYGFLGTQAKAAVRGQCLVDHGGGSRVVTGHAAQ
jgi:hypothetical protein